LGSFLGEIENPERPVNLRSVLIHAQQETGAPREDTLKTYTGRLGEESEAP